MMKIEIDLDDYYLQDRCEILRGIVFKQLDERGCYSRGCYSTFVVQPGFVEIDPHKYEGLYRLTAASDECDKVTAYENEKLVAMWYWDGDGTLLFWVKGERIAYVSTDCKKDYEWEIYEVQE